MSPFSIENIAFEWLGYAMSWVELWATLFSVCCVWLAIKRDILNWPVAIVANVLTFFLFYQNSLYADSFLQIFFFCTSCYGWWFWSKKTPMETPPPITKMTINQRIKWSIGIVLFSLIASYIIIHLNGWWPLLFPQPAAFPVADSFIMVASVAGQLLLAKKKLENWYCWIGVNILAVIVYFMKDIKLFSLLYLLLLAMALSGLRAWRKKDA